MRLSVKRVDLLDSPNSILWVDSDPTELISSLKAKLQSLTSIPPHLQRLIYTHNGFSVLLSESWPCSFYGIQDESLVLLIELKGKRIPLEEGDKAETSKFALGWLNMLIKYSKRGNVHDLKNLLDEFEDSIECKELDMDASDLINKSEEGGWMSLHFASYKGHAEVLKELLHRGANPNKVTKDKWTALQLACYAGHLKCVKELLAHPNILINKMTQIRGTALHYACLKGHVDIVKLLLEHGASMILEDPEGKIPLQLANHEEIIQILPKFMGEMVLKRYGNFSEDTKPPAFSGQVYYTSLAIINDKQVYISLDTEHLEFKHYNARSAYLDNAAPDFSVDLNEIQDVRRVTRSRFGRYQYVFVVSTSSTSFKYYTHFTEATNEWTTRIMEAVNYAHLFCATSAGKKAQDSVVHDPQMPENSLLQAWRLSLPYKYMDDDSIDTACSVSARQSMTYCESEKISLNSFSIIEKIGEGSFGKVYKVFKNSDGSIYALKTIDKKELGKEHLKYAIRECRIMKELDHPFIVTLYYAFQTQSHIYMVLEYCPNYDLLHHLEKKSMLDENSARFYLAEILLAIEYLHSFDILYRDIKPENILIDSSGHVKLTDFGLAKNNIRGNKLARSFCGSPAYISPELLHNKGSGKSADIYGLGALLFELLAGQPPYYANNLDKLYENIKKARLKFPSHIKEDARNLIKKMLDRDPLKRPTICQIKSHSFFRSIDWEALASRDVSPPGMNMR